MAPEFPINETRTAPPRSALFSVNMPVGTEKGRCYSPGEMKHWLAVTGFKNIIVYNEPTKSAKNGILNGIIEAKEVT